MSARRNRRTGQALVPVLFIVMILTAFAVSLATVAKREARSSGVYIHETQQYYAARGAVNLVAAELQTATDTGNQTGSVVGVITRQAAGQGGNNGLPAVDTSQSTMPLNEMITTYSRELNVASDGTKRVNIKTANAQALQQIGISSQMANQLIQGRGNGGASIT